LGSKILVKSYSWSKITTGGTIGIKNLGQKLQLVKNYNRRHDWDQKSWSKVTAGQNLRQETRLGSKILVKSYSWSKFTTGNTIGIKNLGQKIQLVKNYNRKHDGDQKSWSNIAAGQNSGSKVEMKEFQPSTCCPQMGPKEEERAEALALASACSLMSALSELSPRCVCT